MRHRLTPRFRSAKLSSELHGKRVLIVEDEAIVAMLIEDFLEDLGCTIIGPIAEVGPAIEAIRQEHIDCAVLDVNLAGAKSYPIADALKERALPFIFTTGYGEAGLESAYQGHPVLQKPFTVRTFARALSDLSAGNRPDD